MRLGPVIPPHLLPTQTNVQVKHIHNKGEPSQEIVSYVPLYLAACIFAHDVRVHYRDTQIIHVFLSNP